MNSPATTSLPRPSTLAVWITALRPRTLPASIAPVIIGGAIAAHDGFFHPLSFLVALLAAVFIQFGTNLANDFFDFRKGADTTERVGPVRVTQAGWLSPDQVKRGFIFCFAIALVLGIYLVYRGGFPIVLIGLTSILFGILYTGGPAPLGYTGLADLFVFFYFGPVAVAGTYFVQAQVWSLSTIMAGIAGIAPGFFSVAILTANNLRDIETDTAARKKTLSVRFGRSFGRWEYFVAIMVAHQIPLVAYVMKQQLIFLLPQITLPFALFLTLRVFQEREPKALIRVLEQTGQLLLVHSLLFALAWLFASRA